MKRKIASTVVATLLVLSFFSVAASSSAGDSTVCYRLFTLEGGVSYNLTVVIPEPLINYYQGLSHRSASNEDFPKFVTPYALKPVADRLREIYHDDEDFANGVLMLIHQITYVETIPAYYPVETMLHKSGDCDLLALIGASIMKAGGLDVVLLRYADEEHMNLGVHLPETPKHARLDIYSLQSGGVKYYVAESTSTNWEEGWRVGECPEDLKNDTAQVITLEDCDQMAPGQVSASFQKLDPTELTLQVSPSIVTEGGTITLQGKLSPELPNENVTFYLCANGSPWTVLNSTLTQADGQFEYSWKSETAGFYDVRVSWAGSGEYAGTTSQTEVATIIPIYIIALAALAIAGAIVAAVVVLRRRKSRLQQDSSLTLASDTNEMAMLLLGKYRE